MTISPAATATAPTPRTQSPRSRGAWDRWAFRAAVLSLVGLNAWWAWDARSLPPLKEVDRWIARDRDLDAHSARWWEVWQPAHDNDGAIAVLRRALLHSPHDDHAAMMLGRALGARKDYRGAAEAWRTVPYWSPRKPEALYAEGLAWLQIWRVREAEKALLAYLDDDPNHPTPHPHARTVLNKLLDVLALEDRWEDARRLIWRAYDDPSLGPISRRGLLETSLRTRLERSNPAASLFNLRKIVAADPGDLNARRALAVAANAEGQIEEADREIRACLDAHPRDPKTWGARVEMLRARDDFPAIVEAVAQAPPEADADARMAMARGRVRRQERDHAAAAEAFAKAVALTPEDPDARNALALSLRLCGRSKEAEVHRRRHAELEAVSTKQIPDAVNAYKDASERPRRDLQEMKAAMRGLSAACRGMGWNRDADGWARAAEEA